MWKLLSSDRFTGVSFHFNRKICLENVRKKKKTWCWLWAISTSHQAPGALCFFKTNEKQKILTNCVFVLVLFKATHLLLRLISHYCWSGVSVLVAKQRKKGDVSQDCGINLSVPTHTGKHKRCSIRGGGRLRGCPLPPRRPCLLYRSQHAARCSAPPLQPGQPFPTNEQAAIHAIGTQPSCLTDGKLSGGWFQPCSWDIPI